MSPTLSTPFSSLPSGRVALALAAVAGLLVPLAAPPANLSPLAFLAVAGLFLALRGRGPWIALRLGLVAGLVANLLGFYWIVGLLSAFAHLPWIACVLLWLLLSAAQSLGWALASLAVALLARRGVTPLLTLPAALVVAEWAFPSLFPWTLAVTQHRFLPLIQIAEWTGAFGVTLVIAVAGTLAGEAARRRRLALLAIAAAVVGLPCAWGAVRLAAVGRVRSASPRALVGVVQPNVGILDKHDPRRFRATLGTLQELTSALEARGAEIVVWPESAYPYPMATGARRDGEGRAPRVRRTGSVPILFGALTRSPDGERHNSALALDAAGRLSEPVHKVELLAFGEYVPLYREFPFLREAFPRAEGFSPGEGPGVLAVGPIRAGVLNCYEDILPGFGRALSARRPNLLVNFTNDAWFGDTSEPWLHQALAVFRAVELRRDLVRAVDTGVSGFIEATGRIARHSATFERTTLLGEVRLLSSETPYARMGDVVPWACLGMLGLIGILPFRRDGPTRRCSRPSSRDAETRRRTSSTSPG